jgi:hypothetical protein
VTACQATIRGRKAAMYIGLGTLLIIIIVLILVL